MVSIVDGACQHSDKATGWMIRGFESRQRKILISQNTAQAGSGAHPFSLLSVYRGSSGHHVDHSPPSKVKMSGAIPLLHQYAFMVSQGQLCPRFRSYPLILLLPSTVSNYCLEVDTYSVLSATHLLVSEQIIQQRLQHLAYGHSHHRTDVQIPLNFNVLLIQRVKLPLCFTKLHIQKMYGEDEIWRSAFLTFLLY